MCVKIILQELKHSRCVLVPSGKIIYEVSCRDAASSDAYTLLLTPSCDAFEWKLVEPERMVRRSFENPGGVKYMAHQDRPTIRHVLVHTSVYETEQSELVLHFPNR